MKKTTNKKIAPVIVSMCLVGYYLSLGLVLIRLNVPSVIKIVALIVSAALTTVIVFVLIERIKEINEGEEDDLGNY